MTKKTMMVRTLAGVLAVQFLAGGALAADCATAADTTALKVAALQQELMVAAFSCHDIGAYNNFVRSHQPELIASDATLKAFFVRRVGEAAYHTYKTELANGASLRSIHNSDRFCGRADQAFAVAGDSGSLADTFSGWRWNAVSHYACPGVELQLASVEPPRATGWRDRDARDGDRIAADDRDTRYSDDGTRRDDGDSDAPPPVRHRHRHHERDYAPTNDDPAPHHRLDGDGTY